MDYRNAFPFYLTYSQIDTWNQMNEDRIQEDMDYLQQMYPAQTQKYLAKISEVLNMMDYEGSMIYDQYPDRLQIMDTVDTVVGMVKEKEEDEVWLKELVVVLLCHEILKRRHKRHRNMYF